MQQLSLVLDFTRIPELVREVQDKAGFQLDPGTATI